MGEQYNSISAKVGNTGIEARGVFAVFILIVVALLTAGLVAGLYLNGKAQIASAERIEKTSSTAVAMLREEMKELRTAIREMSRDYSVQEKKAEVQREKQTTMTAQSIMQLIEAQRQTTGSVQRLINATIMSMELLKMPQDKRGEFRIPRDFSTPPQP
jgi:Na+-translocating ferredoxin:NAD+ oxidoreductase RnfG subunit